MPNKSLRMTETAERMNSHSKARKATLMIVRAISDMAVSSSGGSVDEHSGGADLDPCSLLQDGLLHPLSVHHNAVGRTKIDDVDLHLRTGRVYSDLGVPP